MKWRTSHPDGLYKSPAFSQAGVSEGSKTILSRNTGGVISGSAAILVDQATQTV